MEPEFTDEERIPLLERDENNEDDSIYEDSQTETSFHSRRRATTTRTRCRDQRSLERGFNVKIPPEERVRFRLV